MRAICLPQTSTAPHRPTAPPVPTMLCGVDPGISYTGYAVLADSGQLAASGTWIPKRALSVLERHLWILAKLRDLLTRWQPGVLAYEGFQWMAGDNGEHFVRGRPALERLIGGIQTLTLFPPYPVLMELLPSVWGQQLVGSRSHTKEDVARVVNLRMGTTFKGDRFDNHQVDGIGIALVAQDTLRHWHSSTGRGNAMDHTHACLQAVAAYDAAVRAFALLGTITRRDGQVGVLSMAIYTDDHCIVDTDYLICAHGVEGHGEHDGSYAITVLFEVYSKTKRDYVEYPTKGERDAALKAIGTLMEQEEGKEERA